LFLIATLNRDINVTTFCIVLITCKFEILTSIVLYTSVSKPPKVGPSPRERPKHAGLIVFASSLISGMIKETWWTAGPVFLDRL